MLPAGGAWSSNNDGTYTVSLLSNQVRDNAGSTYDDYGLTGVPETYWLSAGGRIIDHYAGAVSRDQLEAGIQAAAAAR